MYLVINKCVTAVKVSNFSGHYLRNRSTLYIGVLGYIGIHTEHSPEVWHIPPGTPCIPCLLPVFAYNSIFPVVKHCNKLMNKIYLCLYLFMMLQIRSDLLEQNNSRCVIGKITIPI